MLISIKLPRVPGGETRGRMGVKLGGHLQGGASEQDAVAADEVAENLHQTAACVLDTVPLVHYQHLPPHLPREYKPKM